MAPSVPKPDYNNTPMCIKHALFLHSLSPALIFLAPLFFAALSAILTQCIRYVTPGVRVKPKTPTPADATTTTTTNALGDVESTATPTQRARLSMLKLGKLLLHTHHRRAKLQLLRLFLKPSPRNRKLNNPQRIISSQAQHSSSPFSSQSSVSPSQSKG
jgi:hypothetical protein